MADYLKSIVKLQKEGKAVGIYSACTGNKLVLEACMRHALDTDTVLLIESTANQVDQYGGYTGMKPADFMKMCKELAHSVGFPVDRMILGGDHLGPLTFARYDEEKAMEESRELVRQYVAAGYTKIHLDTSMKVASDDPEKRLPDETIARRGAELAKVAEETYAELVKTQPDAVHPVYIVGSEVPIPGGSQDEVDTGVQVTKVDDFKATVKAFEDAFAAQGLEEAWKSVIAVVVQPGVEEKDAGCTDYDREKAKDLAEAIKDFPNLVFEAHSTDYQTKENLRQLVEDGSGILKVGPGLSYAMREGLFALAFAEKEVFKGTDVKQSQFMEVLDRVMVENPKYFQKHYYGTEQEIAYKRKYSFSDRCRYYYANKDVEEAINTLFENFKDGVPLGVLSQFMPIQYTRVRSGALKNDPKELVMNRVMDCVDAYLYGSDQVKLG